MMLLSLMLPIFLFLKKSSAFYICCLFSNALKNTAKMEANHINPDQTVPAFYYIPITDTTLELSVFWLSDTESRINELRFSESISLSFKTRLTSVTCFCDDVT